jgi:hypothetical protein
VPFSLDSCSGFRLLNPKIGAYLSVFYCRVAHSSLSLAAAVAAAAPPAAAAAAPPAAAAAAAPPPPRLPRRCRAATSTLLTTRMSATATSCCGESRQRRSDCSVYKYILGGRLQGRANVQLAMLWCATSKALAAAIACGSNFLNGREQHMRLGAWPAVCGVCKLLCLDSDPN